MLDYLVTDILSTRENKEIFLEIKRMRIVEAAMLPHGTNHIPTVTDSYGNKYEAAFLKPGKEASRVKPNIYDMYPNGYLQW